MFKVLHYYDSKGVSEIQEYIDFLLTKKDKDSKIKLSKINGYIEMLGNYDREIGYPIIRPIDTKYNLWELRPDGIRIPFYITEDNVFILLSYFLKDTQKFPKNEKEKAIRIINRIRKEGYYES